MAAKTWDISFKWFWNEDIWLPPNITWDVISNTEKIKYAQFNDLLYAFPMAFLLLTLRFVFERYIFAPVGLHFGLKRRRNKKAPDNAILEKAFRKNCRPGNKEIAGLAKQLDWTTRQVERWLRMRSREGKPTSLMKFTESAWRFTFYLCSFCIGVYVVSDKPWLWDTNHCWYDYPHHTVTEDIWWYYMLEMGFYWSLTISQFSDIKRKDFLQMFAHHIITILLLAFSWTCNFTRIGTLVLVIHDIADIPLEATKMAIYVSKQSLADCLFVVFAITWIISRLILYPCRVIYYTMFVATKLIAMYPVYYIFNSLLCGLQLLHIFWTWMLIRVALRVLRRNELGSNKKVRDCRSDDDDTTTDDNDSPPLPNEDHHHVGENNVKK